MKTKATTLNPALPIRLDGQVALVTGAGRGLGREFALALAEYGARVVVNGRGSNNAEQEKSVVESIIAKGGEAIFEAASVTDDKAVTAMVERIVERWGQVDILINNAGLVNDKRFSNSTIDDFKNMMDVHLMGAARCTHAVWPQMLKQGYGRVVMITSFSGLAGNVGQASYAAAKMGMIGLMNSLAIEGKKKGVYVNALSPMGATRMNQTLFSEAMQDVFQAKKLTSGLIFLASKAAPNRCILLGGGGSFERVYISMTKGCLIEQGADEIALRFDEISNRDTEVLIDDIYDQMNNELSNAQANADTLSVKVK